MAQAARPHPQPRPAIEHAQEGPPVPGTAYRRKGIGAIVGREGIARTGREPARPRQVRVRDRGSPRPPDRGLSARRAPTATWSEAGHGGNPGLSPHSGIGDGRYTCQRRTTRCFPRTYREVLPAYDRGRATPVLAPVFAVYFAASADVRLPQNLLGRHVRSRYRRRSHPGRYTSTGSPVRQRSTPPDARRPASAGGYRRPAVARSAAISGPRPWWWLGPDGFCRAAHDDRAGLGLPYRHRPW
jgi:hypothetical protein